MSPEVMAAGVDLNHPAWYLHWGFLQISAANLIVIVLMLVIFALAILLPFPKGGRKKGDHS
jgi:hypothetical protein